MINDTKIVQQSSIWVTYTENSHNDISAMFGPFMLGDATRWCARSPRSSGKVESVANLQAASLILT